MEHKKLYYKRSSKIDVCDGPQNCMEGMKNKRRYLINYNSLNFQIKPFLKWFIVMT